MFFHLLFFVFIKTHNSLEDRRIILKGIPEGIQKGRNMLERLNKKVFRDP
jgi:hypothetical protein